MLTNPGDEIIVDELGHIFNYEGGAASVLSGIQLRTLRGTRGKITPELIEPAIRSTNEWDPWTRVISLENTTNKGGGAWYTKEELQAIRELADRHGLYVHLDGARIWNAITESKIDPAYFGTIADTLSICFSKGLGAPVGSMMLSTADRVRKTRRYRKMWGGGMRQIGILAAAADYAVDHHFPLMKEDHRRAREFAAAIHASEAFDIDPATVETNIVLFDCKQGTASDAVQAFADKGIGFSVFGHRRIRATFHFQITDDDLARVIEAVQTM
jgi:Threonine aldolase